MIKIREDPTPASLEKKIKALCEASGAKIKSLEASRQPEEGAPVFTINGQYTSRGGTEWTQGFQFGAEVVQFDATGAREFLDAGRAHDHGFNNLSTYGNLLRLMNEGRIAEEAGERNFMGSVQAARWTKIAGGGGYIYSFNGPHSLFVDTILSLRALGLSYQLGHLPMSENDERISLLDRLLNGQSTARYCIYYGKGRDFYDVLGRTAHESIFE